MHAQALRSASPVLVRLATNGGVDPLVVAALADAMKRWCSRGSTYESIPVFSVHVRLLVKMAQALLRGLGWPALQQHMLVPTVLDVILEMPLDSMTSLVKSLMTEFVEICDPNRRKTTADFEFDPSLPTMLNEGARGVVTQQSDDSVDTDSEDATSGSDDDVDTVTKANHATFSQQLPYSDFVVSNSRLNPQDRLLLWWLSAQAHMDSRAFFSEREERPDLRDILQVSGMKSNVAVIEADSLMLRILSSYDLDFDTADGGQMLHFVFLLEKCLLEFFSRGCLIQVISHDRMHAAMHSQLPPILFLTGCCRVGRLSFSMCMRHSGADTGGTFWHAKSCFSISNGCTVKAPFPFRHFNFRRGTRLLIIRLKAISGFLI
jgi:hypothetical protein